MTLKNSRLKKKKSGIVGAKQPPPLKMDSPAVTGFRQISDFASIFLLEISLIIRESDGNGWNLIQKYPGVV